MKTRYLTGREYTRSRAAAEGVDISGIAPQACLTALGATPAEQDWVTIDAIVEGTGVDATVVLMPLVGNPAHGTVPTLTVATAGDYQLWNRIIVGEEIIPRPVEIVEVL